MGERFGDDSPMVVMEFTEVAAAIVPVQTEKKIKKSAVKTEVNKTVKKLSTAKKPAAKVKTKK
jgi:hypothetical protein